MSFDIPKPTGPYPVACHEVLDKTGAESSHFRIYYPTEQYRDVEEKSSEWMSWDSLSIFGKQFTGGGFCSRIFRCYFKDRKVPLWKNGPLLMPEKLDKLPVALISHGLMLSKDQYNYLSYEIASYGFLVAAVDHRDGSAYCSLYMEPGEDKLKSVPYDDSYDLKSSVVEKGRFIQMERRVKDMSNLMDCVEQLNNGELKNVLPSDVDLSQFMNRIDTEKCAVIGHSYGGATVISSLASDDRFKVGIPVDPWMGTLEDRYLEARIEKPILFINCIGQIKEADVSKMMQLSHDFTGSSPERTMVTILGATHLTHTDFAYFPKTRWLAKAIFKTDVDPEVANGVSSEIMMGFLGKHLELPFAREADDVIATHSDLTIKGSNLLVDDQYATK